MFVLAAPGGAPGGCPCFWSHLWCGIWLSNGNGLHFNNTESDLRISCLCSSLCKHGTFTTLLKKNVDITQSANFSWV